MSCAGTSTGPTRLRQPWSTGGCIPVTSVGSTRTVTSSSVIARTHPTLGEVPILFVALNAGAAIDEADINDHLAKNLTRVKLPVEIYVVEALPKNPVGKIDKRSLREYQIST